jgi:hypothetical protein
MKPEKKARNALKLAIATHQFNPGRPIPLRRGERRPKDARNDFRRQEWS